MTLQGKAIKQAAIDFGDGKTLPFTPCKKGFIPLLGEERRYACPLHNKAREKRLNKEKGKFRPGEVDLNIFWSRSQDEPKLTTEKHSQDAGETSDENVLNGAVRE
eukprot:scaffold2830_cov131-Cylindrotheca_fusiformis.AAC.92